MTRRAAAAAALAIVLVAGPGAAGAHEVDPLVRTVIDQVEPEVPGLRIEVATSVTTQLVVANDTGEVLEVLDEEGRPFLRIGPDGVEADVAAAAWFLSNQPFGGTAPEGTGGPARWARVSAERSWGWFDHRLHPSAVAVPGEDGHPAFEVRMRLGGRPLLVRGHLERRAVVPRFSAALRAVPDPDTGLEVQLLDGRAPGLFARYVGAGEAVVEGAEGEPFLRLRPTGVEVNRHSPTWRYSAQAKGEELPEAAADPSAAPDWSLVASSPAYAWLDPRALIADVGDEDITHDWLVPIVVDGRRVEVAGTSTAALTPVEELAGPDSNRDWAPWLVGLGALSTVGVVALLLLARARG